MRNFLHALKTELGTPRELLSFLARHKLWWLIPLLSVLILFAILLMLAQSSGTGEAIYPLF